MTYNTTHFLTEAALLFQDRLDRIDEADSYITCQREADRAAGIADTLRTFANCLKHQDQIDDIYDLMAVWENQISDHLAEKADELGCDGGTTEQEPTP